MKILITGGAGFIGSHVVRLMVNKYPQYKIYNLDALNYAGNLENIQDIENAPNYKCIKVDINDEEKITALFLEHQFDRVIHLAAESHVDRSISDPAAFVKTNILGTLNLLNGAKQVWKEGSSAELITYIKDRPGHDKRYAIGASKINEELGWKSSVTFEEGLGKTIDWCLQNEKWLKNITSGKYHHIINSNTNN